MNESRLDFIKESEHKSHEMRSHSFQGASSRFKVPCRSGSKGGSIHPNQENIGDTRNIFMNKSIGSSQS
jgi:hypothetical protein